MSLKRFFAAMRSFSVSPLARLLQIAVTLALTAWIASALDARAWAAMRSIGSAMLASAIFLFASAQILGGLRLALLLPGQSLWREALTATVVGYFWGNFLPGTVGGDVVRGFRLRRAGINVPTLAGTLLLDRLLNIAALLGILLITAWPLGNALFRTIDWSVALPAVIALLTGAVLGIGTVWWSERVRQIGALVFSPLLALTRSPMRFLAVVGLSLLSLGVAILAEWLIARQLGLAIGLGELTGIICLVTVIVLIPISLNGLGLQEASFLVLLTHAGASADLALSFSLLARVLIVGASMIAGLVVLADRLCALWRQ